MDVAIPFLRWGVITEFAALGRLSMFHQILSPTGNLALTWLVALVPVVMLLVLLAVFRVSAWLATLIGSLVTFLLAVWVWKMPFGDGLRAYLYGSATGIWAVDWITVWGVILFNTLVTSLADPLASTQVLSPLAPQ
jgi:lactate permease